MKILFLLFAMFAMATPSFADDPPTNPYPDVPIIITKDKKPIRRDVTIDITGTYCNGVIDLCFQPMPESATIEVVNAMQGVVWSGEVTPVGGYCQIEIGTDCAGENTIYIEIGGEAYHGAFLLDTL